MYYTEKQTKKLLYEDELDSSFVAFYDNVSSDVIVPITRVPLLSTTTTTTTGSKPSTGTSLVFSTTPSMSTPKTSTLEKYLDYEVFITASNTGLSISNTSTQSTTAEADVKSLNRTGADTTLSSTSSTTRKSTQVTTYAATTHSLNSNSDYDPVVITHPSNFR